MKLARISSDYIYPNSFIPYMLLHNNVYGIMFYNKNDRIVKKQTDGVG